jgi:hypothetical protein
MGQCQPKKLGIDKKEFTLFLHCIFSNVFLSTLQFFLHLTSYTEHYSTIMIFLRKCRNDEIKETGTIPTGI